MICDDTCTTTIMHLHKHQTFGGGGFSTVLRHTYNRFRPRISRLFFKKFNFFFSKHETLPSLIATINYLPSLYSSEYISRYCRETNIQMKIHSCLSRHVFLVPTNKRVILLTFCLCRLHDRRCSAPRSPSHTSSARVAAQRSVTLVFTDGWFFSPPPAAVRFYIYKESNYVV